MAKKKEESQDLFTAPVTESAEAVALLQKFLLKLQQKHLLMLPLSLLLWQKRLQQKQKRLNILRMRLATGRVTQVTERISS